VITNDADFVIDPFFMYAASPYTIRRIANYLIFPVQNSSFLILQPKSGKKTCASSA